MASPWDNYVPKAMLFGDSTTAGVGASVVAAFREASYGIAWGSGFPYYLCGTQSWPGGGGGMAADPWCEGIPGITAAAMLHGGILDRIGPPPSGSPGAFNGPPDIVQLGPIGVNDLIPSDHAKTPQQLADIWSQMLDVIAAKRWTPHFRIVMAEIFPTLASWNPKVVEANALIEPVVRSKPYAGLITIWRGYKALPRRAEYYTDPVHPNNTGYNLLGKSHAAAIREPVGWARGPSPHNPWVTP